jgi:nucleoside-diphosphate-sugar epimerase
MARILLVGGTGLIGREFLNASLAIGDHVTVLGRRPASPYGVDFLQADLSDVVALPALMPRTAFDAVVYLAQADGHQAFPEAASLAVAVNLAAPVALCQWAVQNGSRQFVYASSGGVCGPGSAPAVISEDWPRQGSGALTFYLSTKARCEALLEPFAGHIQLDLLRYFFVYGPQQKDNFLFKRLARRVAAQEVIELASGTGPTLNPIHAVDAARLTRAAIGTSGERITNIAGDESVQLADVVQRLAHEFGVEARTRSTPEQAPSYLASTARMQSRLGAPSVSLDQGIRELAGALKQNP